MANTSVQAVFEAALARSTANDGGKLVVDGEMIAHLNRFYQQRHALMAVFMPDNAAVSATQTFATSGPRVTSALPGGSTGLTPIDIIKIEALSISGASAGARVYMTPIRDKDRIWNLTPAVYREGNSLVSCGRPGDPVNGSTATMFYVDPPAVLSALSSTLDPRYPVRFEMGLILNSALYMAIKDEERNPAHIAGLQAELDADNKTFLKLIGASDTVMGNAAGQVK